MRIIIFILVVFFVFIAFFGKLNYVINNPFLAYLLYILNLAVKFFPIILIIFLIITSILIWRHYKHKHSTKKTFHSVFLIFEVLIISIFSAFILLFIVGIIQVNIYSILMNKNPATLGVKTYTKDIHSSINENASVPNIIVSNNNSKNNVIALAKASSGNNNFYGEIILSNIPKIIIIPIKNELSNLLLLDNSLIINKVNITDIEKISPEIGYLMLKNNFPLRDIKKYPNVSVMDENEYLVFRKKDAQQKINKIISESEKMEDSVSSISASITQTQLDIEVNKRNQLGILEERDKEFNDCLSEGKYGEKNKFIPNNTKQDCQPIIDKWESQYIAEENLGKELAKKIDDDQKALKVYEYYDSFFKAQKKLTDFSVENIPGELGVFIPENKVKVVLLGSDNQAVIDYFVTLAHEYLHYASYTPGKRLESSFFEEGLSEYFARQTIKSSMKINTNIGYPIANKIIEEITKKIPEADLADIYFAKDQALLEDTLNLIYGEGFYENNIVLFESLMYSADEDQALELANSILDKIDSPTITKDDVYSNLE